jgi:hypothetical protein
VAEQPRAGGLWTGTSENFQRVRFRQPSLEAGALTHLRITGLAGEQLLGEPEAMSAMERKRA